MTNMLYDYIINKNNFKSLESRKAVRLRKACEQSKIALSYKENTAIYIENLYNDKDFITQISRSMFYSITKTFFETLKNDIVHVSKDFTVNEVIFVGGTTRIPLFVDICKEIFGNNILLNNTLDPDKIVSMGAAIQGFLLTNNTKNLKDDILLVDVTPMSLGVKTYDDKMCIIISQNTPIPVSKSQMFTNSEDDTNELCIEIYQGNSMYVKNNIYLGSFKLQNIVAKTKGDSRIEVTFTINSDGILSVYARDKLNNQISGILVDKYNYKINNDNIDINIDIDIDDIINSF